MKTLKNILCVTLLLAACIIPVLAIFFSRHFRMSSNEDMALLFGCLCLMIVLLVFGLAAGGVKGETKDQYK
jgi:hypothetical protein